MASDRAGTCSPVTPAAPPTRSPRAGRCAGRTPAGNSVWTTPAFAADGSSFWGSLDLNVYHLDPQRPRAVADLHPGLRRLLAGARLGRHGLRRLVRLQALRARSGDRQWRGGALPTTDHIYSSPALGQDARRPHDRDLHRLGGRLGVRASRPAASCSGAMTPVTPIRSSPALGPAPGRGGSDRVRRAPPTASCTRLTPRTGRRRWSYDTTPVDPALRDRNDLNASPALGRTGRLHRRGGRRTSTTSPTTTACITATRAARPAPAQDLGQHARPGVPGQRRRHDAGHHRLRGVSPATVVNLRLIVRRRGRTVNAAILAPARSDQRDPKFAFTTQESGDGHYLYVVPDGPFLAPGTTYRSAVAGAYTDNGVQMGNFNRRGAGAGRFARPTIRSRPRRALRQLPLAVGAQPRQRDDDQPPGGADAGRSCPRSTRSASTATTGSPRRSRDAARTCCCG